MIFIAAIIAIGIVIILSSVKRERKAISARVFSPDSANTLSSNVSPKTDIICEGEWLTIPRIDFFGQYSVSANKQFTFGWCDGHEESVNSLTRKIPGQFVLLEGQDVILKGRMPRPNDGHVANNGTFAVCDWMATGKLNGTFMVVDRNGSHRIAHLFKANLHNCSISNDGQFAVCQTCNADSHDGNKLSLFDVSSGKLLWQVAPTSGWADTYRFDIEKQLLYTCHRTEGEFAYSFEGLFHDTAKWETASEAKGLAYRKEMIARYRENAHKLLKEGDFEHARQAFSMWVDFAKQSQVESELLKANKEYSEFAKRDPLYNRICDAVLPKIAEGETRQSDLYKIFPQFRKEDIFYVLYFAADHGKVSRIKKGNTYAFAVISAKEL